MAFFWRGVVSFQPSTALLMQYGTASASFTSPSDEYDTCTPRASQPASDVCSHPQSAPYSSQRSLTHQPRLAAVHVGGHDRGRRQAPQPAVPCHTMHASGVRGVRVRAVGRFGGSVRWG
jgi:hypothetical protein